MVKIQIQTADTKDISSFRVIPEISARFQTIHEPLNRRPAQIHENLIRIASYHHIFLNQPLFKIELHFFLCFPIGYRSVQLPRQLDLRSRIPIDCIVHQGHTLGVCAENSRSVIEADDTVLQSNWPFRSLDEYPTCFVLREEGIINDNIDTIEIKPECPGLIADRLDPPIDCIMDSQLLKPRNRPASKSSPCSTPIV